MHSMVFPRPVPGSSSSRSDVLATLVEPWLISHIYSSLEKQSRMDYGRPGPASAVASTIFSRHPSRFSLQNETRMPESILALLSRLSFFWLFSYITSRAYKAWAETSTSGADYCINASCTHTLTKSRDENDQRTGRLAEKRGFESVGGT